MDIAIAFLENPNLRRMDVGKYLIVLEKILRKVTETTLSTRRPGSANAEVSGPCPPEEAVTLGRFNRGPGAHGEDMWLLRRGSDYRVVPQQFPNRRVKPQTHVRSRDFKCRELAVLSAPSD